MTTCGSQQVVFIDSRVPDIQDLLNGTQPDVQAFVLDPGSDGLQQIADILAANNLTDLASISIVSHGASGALELGSSTVTDANLASNASALAAIGAALASGGDIQLYGCDVALGSGGQQFISDFSTLAGAVPVEASTHTIGLTASGENWMLDASTAPGPAPVNAPFTAAAEANFQGQLVQPLTGQLYFRINQGNDVQLGDINTDATGRNTIYIGGGYNTGTNGNETSVAVDTAAGLVFSVGIGNAGSYDAFSVHNLNTGALISTTEFGANTGSVDTDDIVQAVAINQYTHTLYVGDWGVDATTTGVREFTYNPANGALTPVATNGGFLFTASQISSYVNANAFYLDTTHNLLYYVNDDTGYNTSPFSAVNGVYVVNLASPTSATELTSNANTAGGFPVATGGGGSIGVNGNLLGLAVDVADGIVFFESTDVQNSANNALWWVSATGGANQTAHKVDLAAAGVTLNFAGQTNEGGDAAGLTFDAQTGNLYLSNAYEDGVQHDLGAIYVLHWDNGSQTVSLVTSYDTATLVGASAGTVNEFDAPSATAFDNLPVLTTSGTATHAVEQSATIALLTGAPTITDTDGGYLASATVQITGGTFSSNENSTADDHLTIGGNASGSSSNITWSYDAATETLTLTGYDTIANYESLLGQVGYNTTGDNPTDYGADNTRTITWHVSDGAVGDPSSTNTTTTTLTIDAVNDAPDITVGGGDSASIAVNETNSGVNQSRSLTIIDPDSLTETLTLTNFSHTGPTGGLSDATLEGYFSVPSSVNITQATGSASFNWTFNSGAQAFDFLGAGQTLTLNYTIHDVDSNDSNAPGSTSLSDDQAISVTITGTNDAPVVTAGNTLSYTENDPRTIISLSGSVIDVDSADFNGGSLTVSLTANGQPEDQLSIWAFGDVSVAGNIVSVQGNAVGTINGVNNGVNGAALEIDFNSVDATPGSVTELIQHIAYSDNSDNPNTAARTVTFAVNDGDGTANGGADTGTATATIDVTAVNDAPVATITPTEYDGSPNVAINLKNNGLSVSDVDGGSGSETVTLSVTGGTLTVNTGGSGASGGGTGVAVSISGTIAQLNALLNTDATSTVSYVNNTGGSFTLTLAIDDNGFTGTPGHLTAQDTADIILDAPPVVANAGNTVAYTEQQTTPTAILVDSAITVTDADSTTLNSATVKITGGVLSGDLLDAVTTGTAITAVWNGTDTLTLTGVDTPIDYQHVLQSVTFTSSSDDPTNGGANLSRTITWTANDDFNVASTPVTTTINVTAVNDPPSATITPATYAATEGVSLDLKNNGLAVSDPDGNASGVSETVTLSVSSEGVLNVTAGTSGAVVSNNGTSSVTITGTAANINALLNTDGTSTVAYIDNSDTPVASVTLTLAINDNGYTGGGNLTAQDTATINITSVNDPPVFTNLGTGPHPHFTEGGSSVILDGNVTVSDPELQASGNYAGATLTLARDGGANPDDAFAGTGSLDLVDFNGSGENVSLDGGVTFLGTYTNPGDGSISFKFNANATAANIASVMHQIIYADASDNPPSSVQIDWTFSDGNGQPGGQNQGDTGPTPGVATGSVTVDITQVDDPPALLNVAVSASYEPGSLGVILSSGLQAYDPDAAPPSPNPGLVSATITIASGFLAGDELFVNLTTDGGGHFITPDTGTTNIVVQSNAVGQLVLSGLDSVLAYQEVLDAVSYHSTAADPSNGGTDFTRTITWQVSDGALDNSAPGVPHYPETTLGIAQPPTVDLDGSAGGTGYVTSFTENGAPLAIGNTNLSVTDPDNANASAATIVLTNAKPGDALSIAGALPGGIDSSIDTSVPGQITIHLFNSAPLADYQTALGQIRFVNTSDNPDPAGRDITVQVSNTEDSNVAHATVHVIPVNDPPVLINVAASASVAFAGQTITVSPGLTVNDVDNTTLAGATVAITAGTFAGDDDVLSANVAGTSITATYIAATETLTLSGTDTLAHYQQVLDSVAFHSTSADPTNSNADPTRTVTWQLNDGSGSNNLSATATTTIDLRPSPTNDFNGDKISDLLLQNTALGNNNVMIELFNGTSVTSSATISNFTGLNVMASGDFNHDGKADIVLQDGTGAPQIWKMDGTTVTSTVNLPNPGTAWHIIATGDFNHDANTDILWQNSDGTPGLWEMNGTSIIAGPTLPNPGTAWHVIGAGDFNGDGNSDILWQNSDGTPGFWLMNGTTILGGPTLPNPGPSWHVIGSGDFNGDGKSDILWQNSDGTPGIWLMNGTSIIGTSSLPNPGTAWHVIGTSDFNSDGKADILWQNTDGTLGFWEMNGTSIIGSGIITNPGASWQAKDDGPFGTDQNGAQTASVSAGQSSGVLYSSAPDSVVGRNNGSTPSGAGSATNPTRDANLHLSAPDCLVSVSPVGAAAPTDPMKTLAHS